MSILMRLAVILFAVVLATGTASQLAAEAGNAKAMAATAMAATPMAATAMAATPMAATRMSAKAARPDGKTGDCTLCTANGAASTAACDLLCKAPVVAWLAAAVANAQIIAPASFGFPAHQVPDGRGNGANPRPPRTINSI